MHIFWHISTVFRHCATYNSRLSFNPQNVSNSLLVVKVNEFMTGRHVCSTFSTLEKTICQQHMPS